jgi:hypothetical protein
MNRPEQRRSYWDDGSWVGPFSLRLYLRERWFVFAERKLQAAKMEGAFSV